MAGRPSCRSVWKCRQGGPSLAVDGADAERREQDVPGISGSRLGPFRGVGDVEILIPSSSSSASDPVDVWGLLSSRGCRGK